MIDALLSGVVLGLTAGLAPGPLMTLVVAQTLRHGARAGYRVALAPLITDAPIILLAGWMASVIATEPAWLGLLSLAGGGFVLFLAVDTWRASPARTASAEGEGTWWRGIVTNLLSPHPWLFWMTAGTATLARLGRTGWGAPLLFLALFYGLLVGAKAGLVLLTGSGRHWLEGRAYPVVMRALAILLAGFGVLMLGDGVRRLGGLG